MDNIKKPAAATETPPSKTDEPSTTTKEVIDLSQSSDEEEAEDSDAVEVQFDQVDPKYQHKYAIKARQGKIFVCAPKVTKMRITYNEETYAQGKICEVTVKSKPADNINFHSFPYHYTTHWTDPKYIKIVHSTIMGKIAAWRDHTMLAIERINKIEAYPKSKGARQYAWAKTTVMNLLEDLNKMNTVPVPILHSDAISICCVEGVTTQEMADFIVNMSNCQTFSLFFVPLDDTMDDYEIETKFEAAIYSNSRSYGKDPNAE